MSLRLALAVIAAAALPASAARKPAARPARKAAVEKAAAKPAAAADTPASSNAETDGGDAAALFGLGASFVRDGDGALVAAVRPGSRAAQAGLLPGDRLLAAAGRPVSSAADVATALRAWTPGVRLSLAARRGVTAAALETAPVPPAPDFARGSSDLSLKERALAAERENRSAAEGRAAVKAGRPLSVPVRADQSVWARFPKDLPAGLKAGDEVAAETAAALTVDGQLDFLGVPPGSRLRARVLEASDDGELRSVRLGFYALDLKGGGTYAALGSAIAVSGAPTPARASSGGTLLVAAPLAAENKRRPAPLLGPEARVRVRLLEPLVLEEPPAFWRAGPGLWIKTIEGGSGTRLYELTHVVPGRSAEHAGLKAGDRLDGIGGKSTDKLDFAEALDRLYGAPGSDLEVSVMRGAKSQTLKLKRGVKWAGDKAAPLPLPFEAQP